jgi:hypothetical protein
MAAAAADVVRLSAMGTGLQKTMTSLFGYNEFRGDQVDVMESIIAGESLAWLHIHTMHCHPRDARTTLHAGITACHSAYPMHARASSSFVSLRAKWSLLAAHSPGTATASAALAVIARTISNVID